MLETWYKNRWFHVSFSGCVSIGGLKFLMVDLFFHIGDCVCVCIPVFFLFIILFFNIVVHFVIDIRY